MTIRAVPMKSAVTADGSAFLLSALALMPIHRPFMGAGHFADSLWGGRFTEVEADRAFGKTAAAGNAPPCTGNSRRPVRWGM